MGAPDAASSRRREAEILLWLEHIAPDAERLFLVGDVFDFWFEYGTVVPKGCVRLLGKLAEMSDRGVEIHLFCGNHDLWLGDYLPGEIGLHLHKRPIDIRLGERLFRIGHGDGLGPKDYGYKFLKKIFTNPVCRWLFRWLHPDIGTRLAGWLSRRSRAAQMRKKDGFKGEKDEWLLVYAQSELLKNPNIDYFIFGHRHLPLDITLRNGSSRYINLGEWLQARSYAVFDGQNLQLLYWEREEKQPD